MIRALALCLIASQANALTVNNDGGGSVIAYAQQVASLVASGEPVAVSGYCASSCTMLLAANTCTERSTTWAFHGPSSQYHGVALPEEEFEKYSQLMASHYPAPVKRWFLDDARHIIIGFKNIRGSWLIDRGYAREC